MSKNTFEHYVNLIIIDASIKVCDGTEFSTFELFANNITSNVKIKEFKIIEPYLTPMITELTDIMCLPIHESATFVAKFFKQNKWEDYYLPMKNIKDQFGIFLVS